ncbi:MAG: hypothetical protein ACI4RF_07405 [Eubacterium sp.]
MKKILTLTLILILSVSFLSGCNMLIKSDEELIEERINSFVSAYNSGDVDGLIECFDSKTKTAMKSALGIGNSLLGGLIGFDISLSDIFGLGMGITDGDVLTVQQINDIQVGTDTATADVTIVFSDEWGGSGATTDDCTFYLKSENGGWFISDLKDN